MDGEKIRKLFASASAEDVNLALAIISEKKFQEIADILGEGVPTHRGMSYKDQIILETTPRHFGKRNVITNLDYNVHFCRDCIKLCKRTYVPLLKLPAFT